jgi:hypothetical protein
MRHSICYGALGFALVAGSTAANAQTVITREISPQPVETVITQPVQTVQTTETVRTIRPAARSRVRRQVVTTRRTVVSQRVVAPPSYDVVAPPAPVVTERTYPPPLYDEVAPIAPAATVDDAVINAAPAVTTIPRYRYVYEPDRILVIDPATNIAIQAIPR